MTDKEERKISTGPVDRIMLLKAVSALLVALEATPDDAAFVGAVIAGNAAGQAAGDDPARFAHAVEVTKKQMYSMAEETFSEQPN